MKAYHPKRLTNQHCNLCTRPYQRKTSERRRAAKEVEQEVVEAGKYQYLKSLGIAR